MLALPEYSTSEMRNEENEDFGGETTLDLPDADTQLTDHDLESDGIHSQENQMIYNDGLMFLFDFVEVILCAKSNQERLVILLDSCNKQIGQTVRIPSNMESRSVPKLHMNATIKEDDVVEFVERDLGFEFTAGALESIDEDGNQTCKYIMLLMISVYM